MYKIAGEEQTQCRQYPGHRRVHIKYLYKYFYHAKVGKKTEYSHRRKPEELF